MKKPLLTLGRVVLTLLVVAFACVVVWRMTMYYMFAPWTRDGHIRADVVQISPDVSGLIKQVDVRDNQPVTRDQVLFVIDQDRFKLALRQAQATVADRKETLAQAQRENRRNRGLGNLVAREQLDESQSREMRAQANADATQAAADTARITVVADVVRAYVQVCAANEELGIAKESLKLQAQTTALTQRLRDAGRGDETQVTRSETQVKSLRAELPRYEAQRQAGLFRLSMLLAKPLDQLPAHLATCDELPHIAQLLPVGDGAALLKRRPDVRQAERHLAAATAEIGVATGSLYPDISIGASIGTVGIVDNLGTAPTNRWGFGPLLSWTIPTNGSRARIREAEAATQGALASFDGVVLNAVRETQTSLVQYTAALQRRDALAEADASAKTAADQTHQFFAAGRESFLADLQATRTYTDVRAQLAAANTQVAMSQIDLFLALGGGWESSRAQAPAAAKP